MAVHPAYDAFENSFGINIPETSAQNIKNLEYLLGELTPLEQQLFTCLTELKFTLKHLTHSLAKIQETGTLLSAKTLSEHEVEVNIRGGTNYCHSDDFIFFTIGTGNHSIPEYMLSEAGDIITIPVNQKILADSGLCVGPHLSNYMNSLPQAPMKFGDVVRRIQSVYEIDDETLELTAKKLCHYTKPDGQSFIREFSFAEDYFYGNDVIKGLAYRLILDLRDIGSTYQAKILAEAGNPEFIQHLLNAHFESWDWPEARIPKKFSLHHLDISIEHYQAHPKLEEIYSAASSGDLDTIKRLHRDGVPIDTPYKDQISPLYAAAVNGHNPVVLYLLDNAVDVSRMKPSIMGIESAIEMIGIWCSEDVFKRVIAAKGYQNPHIPEITRLVRFDDPDLFAKVKTNNTLAAAEAIIDAQPFYGFKNSRSIAYFLALEEKNLAWKSLADGANPNEIMRGFLDNNNGKTPLMLLANDYSDQALALAEALIKAGADINARFRFRSGFGGKKSATFGRTALFMAAESGNLPMLELLVSHGADVDILTDLGESALHVARANKHSECVSFLEKNNAIDAAPKVITKEESRLNDDTRKTVAAVIMGLDAEGNRYYAMGRRRNKENKRLEAYVFPGGEVDYQDKTMLHAARREALEETGLNLVALMQGKKPSLLHQFSTILQHESHQDPEEPYDLKPYIHETWYFDVGSVENLKLFHRDDLDHVQWIKEEQLRSHNSSYANYNYFIEDKRTACACFGQ